MLDLPPNFLLGDNPPSLIYSFDALAGTENWMYTLVPSKHISITNQPHLDSNTLQISINTQAIEELEELSAGQQVKIYSLSGRIGNAVKQININTEQISTNSDNIEQNSLDINDLQELVNRI